MHVHCQCLKWGRHDARWQTHWSKLLEAKCCEQKSKFFTGFQLITQIATVAHRRIGSYKWRQMRGGTLLLRRRPPRRTWCRRCWHTFDTHRGGCTPIRRPSWAGWNAAADICGRIQPTKRSLKSTKEKAFSAIHNTHSTPLHCNAAVQAVNVRQMTNRWQIDASIHRICLWRGVFNPCPRKL